MGKIFRGSLAVAISALLFAGCSSSHSDGQSSPNASTSAPPTSNSPSPAPSPSETPAPQTVPASSSEPLASPTAASVPTGGQPGNSSKPAANSPPSETPDPGADHVTAEQIKVQYAGQLAELGSGYQAQIQSLYQEAFAAAASEKSKRELYETYMKKAAALEEEAQAQLNQLLMQMRKALTALNLPLDSIEELRSTFYAEAAKAKASLTAKAKAELGL